MTDERPTALLSASTTGRSVVFWARPATQPASSPESSAAGAPESSAAGAPESSAAGAPEGSAAGAPEGSPSSPGSRGSGGRGQEPLPARSRLDEAALGAALMAMRRREGTAQAGPPDQADGDGMSSGLRLRHPPEDPPPTDERPAPGASGGEPRAGRVHAGDLVILEPLTDDRVVSERRKESPATRVATREPVASMRSALAAARAPHGWAPHGWAPHGWAPHGWAPHGWGRRVAALARAHPALVALLIPALVLRVLTVVAYRTAFEFYGDSYSYLKIARTLRPGTTRPGGYPLLLAVLSPTGELWVVTVVQHLAGIGIGIGIYALLTHRGLPGWLAAAGAAPVLLDAYQVVIEQFVMAETMFSGLLVGAVIALTWSRRPSPSSCAVAGVLLALATATRTVGAEICVVVFVYLVARRVGGRRLLAFGGALSISVLAYALWFLSATGHFGLAGSSAPFLYGRVAPIADCAKLHLTFEENLLCSPHAASLRPDPNFYVWSKSSPLHAMGIPPSRQDKVFGGFAKKVIFGQPLDYAQLVAGDLAHYFAPGRWVGRRDWPVGSWQFPDGHQAAYWHVSQPLQGFSGDIEQRHSPGALGGFLRGYQRVGYLPGPALAVAGLIALGGPLAGRRRRAATRATTRAPSFDAPTAAGGARRVDGVARAGGDRPGARPAGADCLALVGIGMLLLLIPAASVCFDYRYTLPLLVLFPPAAALGWQRMRDHGWAPAHPGSRPPRW